MAGGLLDQRAQVLPGLAIGLEQAVEARLRQRRGHLAREQARGLLLVVGLQHEELEHGHPAQHQQDGAVAGEQEERVLEGEPHRVTCDGARHAAAGGPAMRTAGTAALW